MPTTLVVTFSLKFGMESRVDGRRAALSVQNSGKHLAR